MEQKKIIIDFESEISNDGIARGRILRIVPVQEMVVGDMSQALVQAAVDANKALIKTHDPACQDCTELFFAKNFIAMVDECNKITAEKHAGKYGN